MHNGSVLDVVSYLKSLKNQFWRNYGYHHGKTKLRNLPEVFAIESTNYCNLKCIMCPRGEPDIMDRPLGSMSDDLFGRILDGIDFYKDPCWFHWFGEPLMNPRLFHQIEMAKRNRVPNLGISTNATLLDATNAKAILESGLDTIMIAVDGASKDVYERESSTLREIWNSQAYMALRDKELRGCNDTPLCRNCNQAPGYKQNPLWPLPSKMARILGK